jgi:hypothetical protein
MRTTSKVLIRANNYIAVESLGKLYILRFNDTTESKESLLEEAQGILNLGLRQSIKGNEIEPKQYIPVQLKLNV